MVFDKTYRKLMEYYEPVILLEGVLNSVPRNLLGMETSYENFPMKAPYGFWVDRSGNWIAVPYIGHGQAAEDILVKANYFLKENGLDQVDVYYTYKTLFAEGWMRVQLTTHTVFYELEPANQITSTPQNKFLKMCMEMYDLKNAEKDV